MQNFFENQWVEVFKAGTQTDSAGNTRLWTDSDLKKMVKQYNDQKEHEAPLVVGHPKDNAPAFGWVEELKTDGKMLYAKFKQIVPEFIEAVKQGLYKKRSISLYPDLTLRHIGFLGAMPPAVKGLADIAFKQDEYAINIEFTDNQIGETPMTKELLEKIEALEKAQKEFSEKKDAEIEALKVKIASFEEEETEEEKKAREAKEAEEAKKFNESDARIKVLEAKLQAEERKSRIAEFKEFVNGLHSEGKIVSEKQHDIIDLMEALNGIGELQFSDKKESALDRFKTYLEAQPVMVDFAEKAKGDKVNKNKPAAEQLNDLAEAKAKESKISFSEALSAVQIENPELAQKAAKEI
jgi:hypothetical protein